MWQLSRRLHADERRARARVQADREWFRGHGLGARRLVALHRWLQRVEELISARPSAPIATKALEATYTIFERRRPPLLDMQGALGRKHMGLTPISVDVYVASALGPRQWGGDFQP